MSTQKLPKELRSLVSWSVGLLGQSIKLTHGTSFFQLMEQSRENLRSHWSGHHLDWRDDLKTLRKQWKVLDSLSPEERRSFAHCNTCMLELINRCEAAYRSYRLGQSCEKIKSKKDHSIVFVLTAHPTEARGPDFLSVFAQISFLLEDSLVRGDRAHETQILHLLQLIMYVPLTRNEKPEVADEAKNIYDFALKSEIISLLIRVRQQGTNVMLRTWAGGDKDGHPGVNESTMIESLNMSRNLLLDDMTRRLESIDFEISVMKKLSSRDQLLTELKTLHQHINQLRRIVKDDGKQLAQFRHGLTQFKDIYTEKTGLYPKPLQDLLDLFWLFPALVLPLEIREDSSLVAESLNAPQDYAIGRMLSLLGEISRGNEPKWYVRGFVLSMCENTNDIINGILLTEKTLGEQSLPVVPLFETEKALSQGHQMLTDLYKCRPQIIGLHQKKWGGRFEVMLGYSDSSKESGVFPSRLLISQAMVKIDKAIKDQGLTPIFFHGSGGSVERGGGSIQEQTQWWPRSSIKTFKATYQGEVVARTFATPNIFAGTISKITQQWRRKHSQTDSKEIINSLTQFSQGIQSSYRQAVQDPQFLEVVERSSPYMFLSHLNIGSRPAKRSSKLEVGGLRAIPWILCWTQTRVLFPTWWGVGRTWKSLDKKQKEQLRKAYASSNLFISFVKSLGFTLEKVELAVWRLYLEESSLPKELVESIFNQFLEEFELALKFHRQLTGKKNLLWHKPWLQESIQLRSPMIHPLNILQIMAVRDNDPLLLRKTVTGISCGMMTTG
jgi:phosphoenolpyruvate carboxylase